MAIAFTVAPLTPVLTIALVVAAFRTDLAAFAAVQAVAIAAMLGYPATIVPGIPLFIWLHRKRIVALGPYVGAAALCGFCTFPILVFAYFQIDPSARIHSVGGAASAIVAGSLVVGAPLGMFAGLVFWYIARPDRQPDL